MKRKKNNSPWSPSGIELIPESYANNTRLSLSVGEVEEVDQYLRHEWKISLRTGHSEDFAALNVLSKRVGDRFFSLWKTRSDYLQRETPIPPEIENEFYNLVAEPALTGLIHSEKRTFILDEICVSLAISKCLPPNARILDVGGNSGYLSQFVARKHSDKSVVCEDFSTAAIKQAESRAAGLPNFQPVVADYMDGWSLSADCHLVIACDASFPSRLESLLNYCMPRVQNNGFFLLVSDLPKDVRSRNQLCKHLSQEGFNLLDIDLVGGLLEIEDGQDCYAGKPCLLLQKSGDGFLPDELEKLAQRHWPAFATYANNTKTPPSEKTQAYFNARYDAPHNDENLSKRLSRPVTWV
jgi:hypothetical protein